MSTRFGPFSFAFSLVTTIWLGLGRPAEAAQSRTSIGLSGLGMHLLTEDGVGQTSAPSDQEQACAAAFLVRLNTISARIKRLYITRLKGGPGTLLTDTGPRPAYNVLAQRQRQFASTCR